MSRVCMIGWDGATWDVVRPWVEQGKLPHLAALLKKSVHGPLRSTIPPWSFQAWASFMTGKNPGQHGIYDFFRTPPGTYDLEFVNADHRRGGATFWEILSRAEKHVVAISIPGTFPPDPVNGVMISGFDFPGEGPGSYVDARGMYPPEVYDELQKNVGPHPIDAPLLHDFKAGRFREALDKILETVRQQAATAKYLIKKQLWDCFMIVFGESDGVSHYFWQFCDPKNPFYKHDPDLADSMLRVYQEIDRQTSELLALTPEDTNFFVLSDHGSGGVSDWVLFPNRWLHELGMVAFRGGATHVMARLREKAKQWGIATLPAWVQRRLYRSAYRSLGRFEAKARYGIIDWSRTRAYFDENPYFPVLRINVAGIRPHGIVRPGEEYEAVRKLLIHELEAWRHPQTGERIVEKAYRREEIYSGECLDEAADIIPKWALCGGYNYGFRLSSKSPNGKWMTHIDPHDTRGSFYPRKFSSHRDFGIFLGRGPDLREPRELADARIIDLAPTILTLLGVEPPTDMDGRVLSEILDRPHEEEKSRQRDRPRLEVAER